MSDTEAVSLEKCTHEDRIDVTTYGDLWNRLDAFLCPDCGRHFKEEESQ